MNWYHHPEIAMKLSPRVERNCFWISVKDFEAHFEQIIINELKAHSIFFKDTHPPGSLEYGVIKLEVDKCSTSTFSVSQVSKSLLNHKRLTLYKYADCMMALLKL